MEKVNVYVNVIHRYHPPIPELNQADPYFPPSSALLPETADLTSEILSEGGQLGYPNQITVSPPEMGYLSYLRQNYRLQPEINAPKMEQIETPNQPIAAQPDVGTPTYPGVSHPLIPDVEPPIMEQPVATSDMSSIEQQIFELTNRERSNYGLPPLQINQELNAVAKRKSMDMGDLDYFSHNGPDGKTTMDWLIEKGYSFNAWGENIANFEANVTAEEIIHEWMNSPGHRENILANNFTLLGVGVYHINGRTFATQVFGYID